MTQSRGWRMPVVSLSLLLAACGRPGGGPPAPAPPPAGVELPTGPYAIAAAPTAGDSWTPLSIGRGYDAIRLAMAEQCLTAGSENKPAATALLGGAEMSASELATLFSPDGGFTTLLPFDDPGPRGSLSRAAAAADGWLSVGAAYPLFLLEQDWVDVTPDFRGWTVVPDGPDFVSRCGDYFVRSYRRGGQLLAFVRLDFADEAAREAFFASGPGPRLGALEDVARLVPLDGRVGIHVSALQRGGDPARLSARLRASGSREVASYWSRDCRAADPRPCRDFVRAVMDYLADAGDAGFSGALAAMPADLYASLGDWPLAGRFTRPRRPPDAVLRARWTLGSLRSGQEAIAERVRVVQAGTLSAPASALARLPALRSRVQAGLAALAAAQRACREELTDPADTAQVARCVDGAAPAALAAAGYDAGLTVAAVTAP